MDGCYAYICLWNLPNSRRTGNAYGGTQGRCWTLSPLYNVLTAEVKEENKNCDSSSHLTSYHVCWLRPDANHALSCTANFVFSRAPWGVAEAAMRLSAHIKQAKIASCFFLYLSYVSLECWSIKKIVIVFRVNWRNKLRAWILFYQIAFLRSSFVFSFFSIFFPLLSFSLLLSSSQRQ